LEFQFYTQVGRLNTSFMWVGQDVVIDINVPPCNQAAPFAPCEFEGKLGADGEGCLFLSTSGLEGIGPLAGDLNGFSAGDEVVVFGVWEPIYVTYCGYPEDRPYFFLVQHIEGRPVKLPDTGGRR
jgi:hypothetical protein